MSAGAVPSNEYLIETVVVPAGGVSSVVFDVSSLGTTYRHLKLVYTARTNRTSFADDVLSLRFNSNSDTGLYATHGLWGGGANGTLAGVNAQLDWGGEFSIGTTTTGVASSGVFGAGEIDILDWNSTSKTKVSRCLSGFFESASAVNGYSAARLYLTSHLWNSTSAITSLTLDQNLGDNFVQGSRFSLYGVTA
jgi:hypothetical protein